MRGYADGSEKKKMRRVPVAAAWGSSTLEQSLSA